MIRAVIHQVLQRLPQGVFHRAVACGSVFEVALNVLLLQPGDEGQQGALDLRPSGSEAVEVPVEIGSWKRARRASLKAFEPEPLAMHDVRERIAHRAKARAQVLHKLVRGERGAGIHGAMIGPGVVVVKHTNLFGCHKPSLSAQLGPLSGAWERPPDCETPPARDTTPHPTGSAHRARLRNTRARRAGFPLQPWRNAARTWAARQRSARSCRAGPAPGRRNPAPRRCRLSECAARA